MSESWDVIVVGAGAAGVFAALRATELSPTLRLLILEASSRPLRKVAISGGGRCNVTHNCSDLDWLMTCYPRGGPRLKAVLSRFMPEDTLSWFAKRGVKLKAEPDGRIFPLSNSAQTIIDCLLKSCKQQGVVLRTEARVQSLTWQKPGPFQLRCGSQKLVANKVLLSTGGASKATTWLGQLGHQIVPDVPSLFTFCVSHALVDGLQGLSVNPVQLELKVGEAKFAANGPLLFTHWGLSGPAVLKLSAFAARALWQSKYQAKLYCDLIPEVSRQVVLQSLSKKVEQQISSSCPFSSIPKRLWQRLICQAGIGERINWRQLLPAQREALVQVLKELKLEVTGKGAFKEEFVSAGGLPLHEIDPFSMESRRIPGLFAAGELLDVDGITGGFNFQNAWASGYIAGEGLARP